MRRREFFWSLYHTTEKNQLDDLRTDQIEAIFAALPKAMHPEWLIWKEGFMAWMPLEEFPKILASLRNSKEPALAPPPAPSHVSSETKTGKPASNSAVKDPANSRGSLVMEPRLSDPKTIVEGMNSFNEPSNMIELSIDENAGVDGRHHVRFKRRLDVRIRLGQKVFTSHTIDISMTGLQLEDALPSGLPRYFQVELRAGEKAIPLTCSEIKTRDGAPSSRVKIESNDHMHLLQALLLTGTP